MLNTIPIASANLLTLLAGCSRAPDTTIISRGQDFSAAEAIAQAQGYELMDAGQLAYIPAIDGFYVRLLGPGDRSLIVSGRDAGKVRGMSIVTNHSQPKSFRTTKSIDTYDLSSDR